MRRLRLGRIEKNKTSKKKRDKKDKRNEIIYRLQSMDLIDKRVKDGVGERLDIERLIWKKKIGDLRGEIDKMKDREIEK